MTDLRNEYVSMDTAARRLRAACEPLPAATHRFRNAAGSLSAFGHLPEAARAKHTLAEAMKQLAQLGDALHGEWTAEAKALTTIADVLRRTDTALAREAHRKG